MSHNTLQLSSWQQEHRATIGRAIAAEWIKWRTLTSTWLTLGVAFIFGVGFATLASWSISMFLDDTSGSMMDLGMAPIAASLGGMEMAMLVIGVLGALILGGEYGTGMIRASFTATPKRWPVYLGKAIILAVVSVISMFVMLLLSFLISQLFFSGTSFALSLTDEGVLKTIFLGAVYIAAVGLIALGITAMVRNTAGAITIVVALVFVLPILGAILPQWMQENMWPYLPTNAATSMLDYGVSAMDTKQLSAGMGTLVLALWVILTLLLGWIVMKRKDA